MIRQHVLLDIDTLVDTRMGILKQHWPDKLAEMDIPKYINRIKEGFIEDLGLDKAEFDAAYAARDEDTLKASMSTELLWGLNDHLMAFSTRGMLESLYEPLEVYINFWPYKLSSEVRTSIINLVNDALSYCKSVGGVYLPITELSPSKLNDVADIYFTYDFVKWMEIHNSALAVNKIPRLVLYYPAILSHPDDYLINEYIDVNQTPFEELQFELSEFISIEAIDPSQFSIALGTAINSL